MNVNEIYKEVGYTFINEMLIEQAFTHTSFAYESKAKIESNERLEFLGDAVLEIVISEYIYINYSDLPEGEMTKVRASVVCEKSLTNVAEKHNFSNFLLVGKCENKGNNGVRRPSMLADCVESVIGAIYLDGGYQHAKKFILNNLKQEVEKAVKGIGIKDYKTVLQEVLQKNLPCEIEYIVIKEEGPEHDKDFYVEVMHNKLKLGHGIGKSKKQAEQAAANMALEGIEYEK